ncbi:hypothetical protein M1555_00440 [Patescibacteria group bacterium]|nr:hypothetical protein [Patescibacteria group bacterium]
MKKNTAITILIVLALSLLPLGALFHAGLPATHDGQDHVARIANFYLSLREGNIVPRWAENLNWGYGHPILMFLYPLPSYFVSGLHALGPGLADSLKIVTGLSYIASLLFFFLWAREEWGNLGAGIGSLLYGFAPYRFVDMYVRGDIGEHLAFVFPPIILWGLFRMGRAFDTEGSGKRKSYSERDRMFYGLLIAAATAGLILAHNAISLMMLPLLGLYAVYEAGFRTKSPGRFLVTAGIAVALGFVLSAFFWVPAFFEGKYTLRDIVTGREFSTRFVPFLSFFYSPWSWGGGNELTKQLGVPAWIAVGGSGIVLWRSKKKHIRTILIALLVLLACTLFLMTEWSLPVWDHVRILQKFQFPWRFLAVPVIICASIASVAGSQLPPKPGRYVFAATIFLVIFTTYGMWQPRGYINKPESFYTGIYPGTTDTGESSPIWSVRFMEKAPKGPALVIEGNAAIKPVARRTTLHIYTVNAGTRTRIVENTLYFPGWTVTVDGKVVPVEFQDPRYRGLMTYWVERGRHEVVVAFGDTKLRRVSDILTLAGIAVVVAGGGYIVLWRKKT